MARNLESICFRHHLSVLPSSLLKSMTCFFFPSKFNVTIKRVSALNLLHQVYLVFLFKTPLLEGQITRSNFNFRWQFELPEFNCRTKTNCALFTNMNINSEQLSPFLDEISSASQLLYLLHSFSIPARDHTVTCHQTTSAK